MLNYHVDETIKEQANGWTSVDFGDVITNLTT